MLLLWIIAFSSSLLAVILSSDNRRGNGYSSGFENVLLRRSVSFHNSVPYINGSIIPPTPSFSLPSTLNPAAQLNQTINNSDIIQNNKSSTDPRMEVITLPTTTVPNGQSIIQPIPAISDPCPLILKYPSYSRPNHCYRHLHVYPCKVHKSFPNPIPPVMEFGIVYYAYTRDGCVTNKRFIPEVNRNSFYVKSSDKHAKIALVTNCDVPQSTANMIDVIVPIHNSDVVQTDSKQWWTRMLYNAYLPFNYSFITDTHVYPCDNKSYSDILTKFKQSNVDISFSCRVNSPQYASGGAVLSKFGSKSFIFWKLTYNWQVRRRYFDDQAPMTAIMKQYRNKLFKFEWLSSNYFYASHGITEKGVFSGPARCYRSSVVVTGPIRWVHGKPDECELMNGKNRELIEKYRVYFLSGKCETHYKGRTVITSRMELSKAVRPYAAPVLNWRRDPNRSSYGLFWY